MSVETDVAEKQGEQKRDETLSLDKIDIDYLTDLIEDQLKDFWNRHEDFFEEREEWLLALRDLKYQYREGYFEHSSDLHVPYTLIMAKAMHAKIFQTFSQDNLFSVEANNVAFEDREEVIKQYMTWVLGKWVNRTSGKDDAIDDWIQQIIDEGSGVIKLGWDRWKHNFVDIDIETFEERVQSIFTDEEELEEGEEVEVKTKIKNVKKELKLSAPRMDVVDIDDFIMPAGQKNVQSSPFVAHKVELRDEDLKLRAQQKKFDEEVVEEALERRMRRDSLDDDHNGREHTRRMAELEGVSDLNAEAMNRLDQGFHTVIEWYGRAYVKKKVDDDVVEDIDELPQEIVVWYHAGIRKILGWTYLHRISPSGRRPFYKADFMRSKERAFGIGVAELLWSINNHIDAVHNLKLDNGVLSSLQFGVYRSSSTFKPDTFRIRPGDLIPVEDVDDFKWTSIPYLGQFGENEELSLTGYGEKLLAINDINLGNLTGRGVAGALRNATGANFVDRQASIQMHPHLQRIARELKQFLRDMFILARSRMDEQVFFRVTGEDGKSIFREVSREDLRGDFDFNIDVDLAAASEAEKQQRVSLMLQTLLNPTFSQLGVIQPGNIFELLKKFLTTHQIRNPLQFITQPPQYAGPPLTNEARLFKTIMGQGEAPPIEDTIRPEENHEVAIQFYTDFQESDSFGLLDTQLKVATFRALIDRHTQLLAATQGAQGVPNVAGTQLPGEGGLPSLGPQGQAGAGVAGSEGGPLGSPIGEVNGPIQ